MALIKCPECHKEISDKAISCPNCGCPINTDDNKLLNEIKNQAIELRKEKNKTKLTVFIWLAVICSMICVIFTFWLLGNDVNIARANLSEFAVRAGSGIMTLEERELLKTAKIITLLRNISIIPSIIFIIVSIYFNNSIKKKGKQ